MTSSQNPSEGRKTLYLVDGSALAYRAYFAFIRNPLINSKGENTSAAFGFVNSLLKIIREEKPDYIGIIFDTKAPTFRHEIYAEYKSTRARMPEEMVDQLPRIHEAVEALNVRHFALPGFEADDIIATLACQGAAQNLSVIIVSGDKDMFQLVDEHIRVYIPQRGAEPPIVMDRESVKEKIGVYPDQVIDLMALTGDSSDHVPGIPGIGPKSALALLAQYGSLDVVLSQAETIAAKGVRQKVLDNKDKAELSRTLVTVDRRVPLEITVDDLVAKAPDQERCRTLFTELEFFNLLKELTGSITVATTSESPRKSTYARVSSLSELEAVVSALSRCHEIAVDTETDALDPLQAGLVGIALSGKGGEGYYIPMRHTTHPENNLPPDSVHKIVGPLLANREVQKIAQNFKFDLHILERHGYRVDPISFDTMLASYVLNPSARGHNLDSLAVEHFNHKMIPISELIGSGKKQTSFAETDPEQAAEYSAEDADYTYRLRGVLAPKIEEKKLGNIYYNIELPLIAVLTRIEQIGFGIDVEFLQNLSCQMKGEMEQITGAIYSMAGYEFNINSTQQLARVLFDDLKLPTKGKTAKKTGYATDVGVLEELSKLHPLPKAILQYRQLTKLKSTYVDTLPELVNSQTGRVHTTFNQAVAATGRLSSSDPNLQNIPVRTEEGREIRKAFIPRNADYLLLAADYSQIELRILAQFSDDPGLISAFQQGEDIHARTAAEVFGVPLDRITPEQRRAAKTANFAVIYGVTAYGLSQQTELDMTESKEFIDTYFERYPRIKNYIDSTIAFARKNKYVMTLHGRRRYLPEIESSNRQVRQFAERTAINTPIQGTAADMIKLAMIAIDKKIRGMRSAMILQVHDELVFDAHREEIEQLKTIVRTEMAEAINMRVPIDVDIGIGANWLEAK